MKSLVSSDCLYLLTRQLPTLTLTCLSIFFSLGVIHAQTQEHQDIFDDLYGEQYKTALNSSNRLDDFELAKELHDAVEKLEDDRDFARFLQEKILELTENYRDAAPLRQRTALALLQANPQRLEELYEAILSAPKARFNNSRTANQRKSTGSVYHRALVEMGDRFLETGNKEKALELYRDSILLKRHLDDEQVKRVRSKIAQIEEEEALKKELETLKNDLLSNPSDQKTLQKLVLSLRFEHQDKAETEKYDNFLPKGTFKDNFTKSITPISKLKLEEAVELAEWLTSIQSSLSKSGKANALGLAVKAYQHCLRLHKAKDTTRIKLDRGLKDAQRSLAATGLKPYNAWAGGNSRQSKTNKVNQDKKDGPKTKVSIPPAAIEHKGHYYLLIKERMTWEQAKAKAESMGGYLAVANDEEEFLMLSDLATQRAWLGAFRDSGKEAWQNLDQKKFRVFGRKQFDSPLKEKVGLSIEGGIYKDLHTKRQLKAFICEWDKGPSKQKNGDLFSD